MAVRPVVQHFIACNKEPVAHGSEITLNDIFVYAIKPRPPFDYPVWHKPFFLFGILTNGLGQSVFKVESRAVESADEKEVVVGASNEFTFDSGLDRLRVWPISIEMPPVLFPRAGLYRLYLMCDGEAIACEEIHAR